MDARELFDLFARCCPGFAEHWRSDRNLARGQEGDPHSLCLEFCSFYIDYAQRQLPDQAVELFREIEDVLAADPNDENDVANALGTCFIPPLVGFPAAELSRPLFGPLSLALFVEEENAQKR